MKVKQAYEPPQVETQALVEPKGMMACGKCDEGPSGQVGCISSPQAS